ncbi:MAG: endolytic transglycosylase MltG [Bacteroidota bacterium]|nr:endolytic transglycosylase MltG [Bacteroidota bacterium]
MQIKKIILFILVAIVLVAFYYSWKIFGPTIQNPEHRFLYIKTGSSYQQVKDSLNTNGFMGNYFVFDKIAKSIDYPKNIKPGKYKISNNMSMYHLLKMLRSGKQVPVNLVITKLRTKEDLAKKIANYFETDSVTVIHFLNNNDSLLQFDVDTNTVMTDIIPNTYNYTWTTPIQTVFKKLHNETLKFWNKDRLGKAQHLNMTPKEIYILASIVEEETNKQDDKGKIASVYINRIRKGMKMAADPTIKFAMKDFGLKRIYQKYLRFVSPYNTYLNSGLPPGPICTPSIKTIDAVLDSPDTNFLFFVARADFSGYSEFATSYREHLVYAKAYQKALDSLIIARRSSVGDSTQ